MALDLYSLKISAEKVELINGAIDAIGAATAAIQEITPDLSNFNLVADNISKIDIVADSIVAGDIAAAINSAEEAAIVIGMKVAKGDAGSQPSWDGVNGILTIPQGATGPQGLSSTTGITIDGGDSAGANGGTYTIIDGGNA